MKPMSKTDTQRFVRKIRQALDRGGLHLHSMSDPTPEQRLQQSGGTIVTREVNRALLEIEAEMKDHFEDEAKPISLG